MEKIIDKKAIFQNKVPLIFGKQVIHIQTFTQRGSEHLYSQFESLDIDRKETFGIIVTDNIGGEKEFCSRYFHLTATRKVVLVIGDICKLWKLDCVVHPFLLAQRRYVLDEKHQENSQQDIIQSMRKVSQQQIIDDEIMKQLEVASKNVVANFTEKISLLTKTYSEVYEYNRINSKQFSFLLQLLNSFYKYDSVILMGTGNQHNLEVFKNEKMIKKKLQQKGQSTISPSDSLGSLRKPKPNEVSEEEIDSRSYEFWQLENVKFIRVMFSEGDSDITGDMGHEGVRVFVQREHATSHKVLGKQQLMQILQDW